MVKNVYNRGTYGYFKRAIVSLLPKTTIEKSECKINRMLYFFISLQNVRYEAIQSA